MYIPVAVRSLLPWFWVIGCCGCASGPVRVDTSDRVVHVRQPDDRQLSYRYGPVPPDWEPITIQDNDVAWHARATNGVVHVDHTCTVGEDVPLPALVQQSLIGFTERTFATEELVPFDGREARHVVVRARLDGVPMSIELYVLKKDGCVYDLGYVAPPTTFPTGQSAFQAFARGFATVETGVDPHAIPTRGLAGGPP